MPSADFVRLGRGPDSVRGLGTDCTAMTVICDGKWVAGQQMSWAFKSRYRSEARWSRRSGTNRADERVGADTDWGVPERLW
jgi:hypothetical protein